MLVYFLKYQVYISRDYFWLDYLIKEIMFMIAITVMSFTLLNILSITWLYIMLVYFLKYPSKLNIKLVYFRPRKLIFMITNTGYVLFAT